MSAFRVNKLCLPALTSVLGAIGLTFEREYFVWVNLVALVLALAVAIMLGRFVFTGPALAWSGLAVLTFASALTTFGRRQLSFPIRLGGECR